MNPKPSPLLCVLFFTPILLSCRSNDNDNVNPFSDCLPVGLRTSNWSIYDSVAFAYRSDRKLDKILLYDNAALLQTNQLEYDGANKLTRYTATFSNGTEPYQTYELVYADDGKPDHRNYWGSNTTEAPVVMRYTYDVKGRLSTKRSESTEYVWRYDYDSRDNVVRTYYKNFTAPSEFLGRENHMFDYRPRFFANSPELTTVAIYILDHEPSKNNVMTATVYWQDPGWQGGPPRDVTHELSYDLNGLIATDHNALGTLVPVEFYFTNLEYDCP